MYFIRPPPPPLPTCSVRAHHYTHATRTCLHFAPLFSRVFGAASVLELKWHVSSCTLACNQHEIGIAQQNHYVMLAHVYLPHPSDFGMWKRNTPLSRWDNLSVTEAFLRCKWMSLFWRSHVHSCWTSLTCVHKHSKCARSVFSQRFVFCERLIAVGSRLGENQAVVTCAVQCRGV